MARAYPRVSSSFEIRRRPLFVFLVLLVLDFVGCYWAVALALLLTAPSVSRPASNTPLPLQSFQAVTT